MKKNKSEKNKLEKEKESAFSFLKFMFSREQVSDWIIVFSVCATAAVVIKYFYPYPCVWSDSGGYMRAAIENAFYVYRPWGYSYFLQVLHSISTSIHFIFYVQLFLFFTSTIFAALTVKYFYAPERKWLWYAFLLLISINLPFLIICNWILSDALFACQMYWLIGLFIHIVKKKSWIALILFEMVLFSCMHVRYSGMIFPFFFIPFFAMLKGYMRFIAPIGFVCAFMLFHKQVEDKMYGKTRLKQFSTGFDGWNYLNNALYVVPHVKMKAEDMKDEKLKDLHSFIITYKDSVAKNCEKGINPGFIWDTNSPLKAYLYKTMNSRMQSSYLIIWIKLGSNEYKKYATYLMTRYPLAFLQYFYLPNSVSAFYPKDLGVVGWQGDAVKDTLFLHYYNIEEGTNTAAKEDIFNRPVFRQLTQVYEILLWGLSLIVGVFSIIKRKSIAFNTQDKIIFWGIFSFAVMYYASTIFASAIEFRYWIAMYFVKFTIIYILLNFLFPNGSRKKDLEAEN